MNKGYLYLLLAAASYASMGVLVRAISVDTGPLLQTFLRLIVASLVIASLLIARNKSFTLKHNEDYPMIILMGGIGYALQIILFTLAIYHTTIGNTLFLMSGYPIVTALLAYLFLKEKIHKNLLIAFVLLCIALLLIFQPGGTGTSLLGNLYALGTCITFSLYVIWSRILSKRGNAPETITLWSIAIGVVVSGIAAGVFETITLDLSPQSLIFLVLFGVLNAAAFTFINKGFALVQATTGTMILMSEPIIGSLLGLLIFHEIPTVIFLIGAGILLSSVAIAIKK
ncbi:MAG TPA: DMT family transporter [Patescibacteria group bacterium]|nr:DMT family transporter [Patescibacteria group bacterium]